MGDFEYDMEQLREISGLRDENEKLREASRLMWQRLRWADEVLGAVLDKRFERRMRELGVEVD